MFVEQVGSQQDREMGAAVEFDEVLKQDPAGRVACETYVTMGLIIIGGEITTTAYVDMHELCRRILKGIGYTHPKYGFDYHTCAI